MTGETAWMLMDLSLAFLLLGLGWAALSSPDMKRGVVLFIAFGLLLSLVWARLSAPDLALAEAAIGAGMTGALLLTALRDLPKGEAVRPPLPNSVTWLVSALSLVLAVALSWALATALARDERASLAPLVAENLSQSGVSNPVTAVLLNFRAYDTLLEVAVLLAAVLGILALGPARPGYRPAGELLANLVQWLVPVLMITAGYLLWVGGHAPGGAFQAGAVLAAVAVLLRLSGRNDAGLPAPGGLRWVLAGGLGAFLAVGLGTQMGGGAFLQYPPAWNGSLILLIETAATLGIAATLALAYIGGRTQGWEDTARPGRTTPKETP